MAQFGVHRNPHASARHAPYLLDVQSDMIDTRLRVVVPLVRPGYFGPRATRLNPELQVLGESFVLSPMEIGSLPLTQLGLPVARLDAHRYDITAALDCLFHGI